MFQKYHITMASPKWIFPSLAALLATLLVLSVSAFFLMNQNNESLKKQILDLSQDKKQIETDLQQQIADLTLKLSKQDQLTQEKRMEDENKTLAAAKQAAKCLPIMKRFGVSS